jgi:NADPH-dependent 2,4-dienoyl-CoA reductase/sulfur reductase-like enzyme/peroxiredoxin family protein/TusA-related sulfurtransferase
MRGKKTVIVGGVAGGASAAARLRRMDETAQIVLVERGEHISFANCGLPYYIGGVINGEEKLVVQTPEKMKARFGLDIRTGTEAVKILRDKKKVVLKDVRTGTETEESYDYLVLSPGADPIKPPIPGSGAQNVFTLRNIPDTLAIKSYVERNDVQTAVVIGGGFIGLEVAENLLHKGLAVSVVEMADQVMPPFDPDMAAHVHQHMKEKNVGLYLKNGIQSFITEGDTCRGVMLQDGTRLSADVVILSIGVRPESKLAREAGLSTGPRGGILVNDSLVTEDPAIFAIGDAIETKDFQDGSTTYIPLAGPANRQGRIVADRISGLDETFEGSQGTSVVKLFDMTAGCTGHSEKLLIKKGIPYLRSYTHSVSHASYYPGATPMAVKLLFAPGTGKVLGAQIAGIDGVEKRIDVIATAIYAGLTVFDLTKLQLSYAPPYSSAKDPVNMAGYVAENILKGLVIPIHWNELPALGKGSFQLVDVSDDVEFTLGTIPGAVNIPVNDLRARMGELDKKKTIVVFCRVGIRGYIASRILAQNGFSDVKNLSGAYKTWAAATAEQGNPIQPAYQEKNRDNSGSDIPGTVRVIDACGLQCPGPIMKTHEAIKDIQVGEAVTLKASDPGYFSDIKVWCEKTGNQLVNLKNESGVITAVIRKGSGMAWKASNTGGQDKTMVVFSGDLDKAIASFIIATGAAAMGRKVTMFFTFWGLNILRKPKRVRVKKTFVEGMFGAMMPRGSRKLALSQMNMGGIGALMIRGLMKKKNVDSLEQLMENARKLGIRIIACNMSMDLMGIRMEELVDGVEAGGVATFLGSTDESNMSLFI